MMLPLVVDAPIGPATRREVTTGPVALSELIAAPRLPSLDGLRMVAFLSVFFTHYTGLPGGDIGLTLFLVLSGFLITRMLLDEHQRTGRILIWRFQVRRLLRIVPPYYVFIAIVTALALWRGRLFVSGPLVACGVTFTMNYYLAFLGAPETLISHAWSLAAQEQFYALWPVAFQRLAPRGSRTLVWCLTAFVVSIAVWRSTAYLSGLVDDAYVYHAFDTRADTLAIGALLAVAAHRGALSRVATFVAARPWLPFATLGIALIARIAGPDGYRYSIGFTIDALLMSALILQTMLLHGHRLWRWLDHATCRYLARVSYSAYLYHGLAWSVLPRVRGLPRPLPVVLAMLAAIALGSVSYWMVETPFLSLKRTWSAQGSS